MENNDELRKRYWSLLNKYELAASKEINKKNLAIVKELRSELSKVINDLEELALTGCFNETGHFWR